MNGVRVGKLEKNIYGSLSFSYDEKWLNLPGARPISLSLPLVHKPFIGDVVYNFFDNLLPDNTEIKSRIQTRFRTTTDQPFDLLASIGKDCVGAIQLLVDYEAEKIITTIGMLCNVGIFQKLQSPHITLPSVPNKF